MILERESRGQLTRIAALDHEVANDPVEDGSVVVPATSKLSEIPAGVRGMFPVKLNRNFTDSETQRLIDRLGTIEERADCVNLRCFQHNKVWLPRFVWDSRTVCVCEHREYPISILFA